TATSTICPACSAHIDLRDYKISSGFSRTIRTCGNVYLTAKGDLSSSSVICRAALIEGKLRGDLHCVGTATINYAGKIPGRITAAAGDLILGLNAKTASAQSLSKTGWIRASAPSDRQGQTASQRIARRLQL